MCICVIVRLNLHLLCQTPATPLLAQSSGRTCRTSATSPSATTARRTLDVPLMGRRSLGVPLLLGEILVSHFDQDALVNNPTYPPAGSIIPVVSNKGGAGWEGWGYCGNCRKEGRSPQCARGQHTVLRDAWRAVKGKETNWTTRNLHLSSQWFFLEIVVDFANFCRGQLFLQIVPLNNVLAKCRSWEEILTMPKRKHFWGYSLIKAEQYFARAEFAIPNQGDFWCCFNQVQLSYL